MTKRELRELLDARPAPRAAERLLARLPADERPGVRRLLTLVRVAGSLPRPEPSPDFVERTMARIARLEPPRRRGWPRARRLARWTPSFAAAAAALLAVAVSRLPAPDPGGGAATASLSLVAPGARDVRAAGDFNRWRPEATPLHRGVDGVWRAEIAVPPGRGAQYMFVVDGAWVTDPVAQAHVDDGFGGLNALLDR